jgi:hypothetical protein
VPLVGLPPAFVPPVVAVPAANAIVPFVAGTTAAGGGAAVASAVAAPLLVGALAGIAVLGIAYGVAQLWGALNQTGDPPPGYQPTSPNEYVAGVARAPADVPGNLILRWSSPDLWPNNQGHGFPPTVVGLSVVRSFHENMPWPGTTGTAVVAYGFDASGVVIWTHAVGVGNAPGYALFDGPVQPVLHLQSLQVFFSPAGGEAYEVPIEPVGTATRTAPELEPLPEPAKAPPVVVPLPYAPPATPEAEPVREPTPARPTRPVVAPPVTRPAPVTPAAVPRTTTPTTPSGQVQPTPQLPPVKTPTTVHVVNGTQIPANGPQATPQGIAQELGRIENKLGRLLSPKSDQPGQQQDRLGWLHDNIGNIIDFFLSINAGGEYRISSPCVLDEEGQRIERVVEYEGSLQSLGVISNKIDALAALLQEHKDLKQPICRETPATGGQSVTVNFVQID